MSLNHLLRLLTLLALLLAPAGMMGGHMAMAASDAPATAVVGGHCADATGAEHERSGDEAPAKSIDCVIACSCIPSPGAELREPPLRSRAPDVVAPAIMRSGLNPGADPPPPRLS